MTIKIRDFEWPAKLLAEYAIIAACFAAAMEVGGLAWYAAALVIGTRQHAIGVIGHWSNHRLMRFSRVMRWACFAPLAIDPGVYQRVHAQHHSHTSDAWFDHEMMIEQAFRERWARVRREDTFFDALGLHVDEAIYVMVTMTSFRALAIYGALLGLLFLAIGPAALIWPAAGATGLVAAHRLRARTEHNHFAQPGITLQQSKPALWRRMLYLPHHTWRHAEHHAKPGARVWSSATAS